MLIDTRGRHADCVQHDDHHGYTHMLHLSATERPTQYLVDFDRTARFGLRRRHKTLHTLPFIYLARGGMSLVGRAHARKLGNLTLKTDGAVKSASGMFSLGPVIASSWFANMHSTVTILFIWDTERHYKERHCFQRFDYSLY